MTIPKPSTKTKPSDQPPPVVNTGTLAAREIVRNRQQRNNNTSRKRCAGLCYVFLGLLLVVFAGSGLILYRQFELDRSNLHSYHDGDQVLASESADDLNSVLCQAYAVSSSAIANMYLTNGKPKISPYTRQVVSVRNDGLKADLQYDYRAFYLLPGSSMKVQACMSAFNRNSHVQAEVLFFKGDKHYTHWRNNAHCHNCVQHRVVIPHDVLCERGDRVIAEHFIEHKDTYYVVITRQQRSDDHEDVRAEIDMQVIKTMYDVRDAKAQCLNTLECKLNLTFAADDDVVVQFTFPEYWHPGSVTYFTTACELRRTFWIAVFGLIPTGFVGVFVILACLCGCLGRDDKKKRLAKQAASRQVFAVPDTNPEKPQVLPV